MHPLSSSSSSSSIASSSAYPWNSPSHSSKQPIEPDDSEELSFLLNTRKRKGEFDEKESKELRSKKSKTSNARDSGKPVQTGGLCEDIWIEILRYLPWQERYATWTRVDKYFHDLVPRIITQDEEEEKELSNSLSGPIRRRKQQAKNQDGDQSIVSFCDGLYSQDLDFEEVESHRLIEDLVFTGGWRGGLSSIPPSETTMKSLEALTSLTALTIHNVWLETASLQHIPPYTEKLSLNYNNRLTSLEPLKAHKLRELHFSYCSIDDEGAKYGKLFTNLRILDLSNNPISEITWIRDLPIHSLSLQRTFIRDDQLEFLPLTLRRASFYGCRHLTNEGMKHLAKHSWLVLNLGELNINDIGVANLGKQLTLRKLCLDRTKITDKVGVTLKTFTALKELDIWRSLVTVDLLMSLKDLPLRKLAIPEKLSTALKTCKKVLDPSIKPLADKLVESFFYNNFEDILF